MIFDRWGNPLGDLPYAIKAIRTRATDGTDTLDITTIGEINKDERIVFKDSTGRWAEYLCQSTQTARAAGMPVTVAYCAGGIAELSRTYIEDKRNRNANAKACLAKALEGTRWTVGTVETGTITRIADLAFYHCTVLEAVQKTADTYGLEVQTEYQPDPTGNRIGQRIIHLVEHRGSTNTTKRFEYGKDLTQIKRDIDAGDVITRLYGWGKGIEQTNEEGEATGGYGRKISFADVNNGKPYIQDDQALANWGIVGADGTKHHSEASVDFPDCEDPKELLNLTKAALKTRTTPVVSYTADVTALGQAGYDPEDTDVGDSVQIIDTSFATPLRLEGRILQIEEDLAGSLADTKITLGNIRQSYTQRMAAQQQALDKLVSNSGAWNSAAGGTGPYMKDLIDRINQIMNATGGYTYLKPGQGIYVYDKPEDQNPTQCIHIGGGYWRIADHKKPNGDWDFRALANGKGIFADTIFTGRLSDAAGLNFWDMDTGDFSLSARSTIGGKTVQQYADGAVSDANSYTDAAKQAAITEAKRQADAADTAKLAEARKYAETKATEALTAAKAQSKTDSDAAKAAAQAYVDALDESLGQRSIFDRLTNNGKTQGIYLSGGLLYLNATYMKTGVLDAALVKAGRLTDKKGLNFWDMDTGEFSLSANTTVGGNKASSLATQTQAQKLATDAQTAAKAYADSVGASTLKTARKATRPPRPTRPCPARRPTPRRSWPTAATSCATRTATPTTTSTSSARANSPRQCPPRTPRASRARSAWATCETRTSDGRSTRSGATRSACPAGHTARPAMSPAASASTGRTPATATTGRPSPNPPPTRTAGHTCPAATPCHPTPKPHACGCRSIATPPPHPTPTGTGPACNAPTRPPPAATWTPSKENSPRPTSSTSSPTTAKNKASTCPTGCCTSTPPI